MTIPEIINGSENLQQLEDTLDSLGDKADQYRDLVYEKMKSLLGQTDTL